MVVDWRRGDKISNRWEILRIFGGPGRSGMGIVYVVYDPKFREMLAAKTFQDKVFADNPQIADRFMQEALVWVNLEAHQNVVEAHFVEKIVGKLFLFLEYVSGGDLGSWIGTPRLTEDLPQVLRFAIQFCDGMIHALPKDIEAHRDIKPQNCLITQDKVLKVTDFGLAKVLGGFDLAYIRRVNAVRQHSGNLAKALRDADSSDVSGTPPYMAPEQFCDANLVDVRSDIYSFGVMLFQMVTGRLPFIVQVRTRKEAWEKYRRAHQSQLPPAPSTQSSTLNIIVKTCLAKEPAHRFANFREVREALAEIYEGLIGHPAPQPVTGVELTAQRLINRSHSLNNLGLLGPALEAAEECIRSYPSIADCWSNKGAILAAMERRNEALVCYERAIALKPDYHHALVNKAATLTRLDRPAEAIECCNEALASDRRDAKAWHNKGDALAELGRERDALTCYDRALRYDPRLPQAWNNRACALMQLMVRELGMTVVLRESGHFTVITADTSKEEALESERLADSQTPHGYLFRLLPSALKSFSRALEIDQQYANARHGLRSAFDFALANLPRTYQSEGWLWKTAVQDEACLEKLFKTLFQLTTHVEFHPRYLSELKRSSLAPILSDNQAIMDLLLTIMNELLAHDMDPSSLLKDTDNRFRLGLHALNTRLLKIGLLEVPTATAGTLSPMLETIGETLHVAKSMNEAGIMYRRLCEFETALRCYELALRLYEAAGDLKFCGHMYYNRGKVYISRQGPGDREFARESFTRALALYQDLGLEEDIKAAQAQLDALT